MTEHSTSLHHTAIRSIVGQRSGQWLSTDRCFPWVLAAFLFVIFAMSSWNLAPPREGYDAANPGELSDTAEAGSLARQIALTCLGLYSIATLGFKGPRVKVNGKTGLAVSAYIIWTCASIFWSTDVNLTSKATIRLLLMYAGAVAISRRVTIEQLARITFLISTLTLAVSVALEIMWGTFEPINPLWRLSGVMHPVSQGWNCSLLCLSAQYVAKHSRGLSKVINVGGMTLGTICLALTKSRLAFASTILVMAIYYFWNSSRLQRAIMIAACGSTACVTLFFVDGSFHHYAAFGRENETEASFGTLTGRIPLWEECIRYAEKRPIFGYGYNTFVSPVNLLDISDASGWMSSPHSGYIGTQFELGAIGLTLLIATVIVAVRYSFVEARRDESQRFVFCVFVWLAMNLLLESFLITGCFFATFLAFTLLAKSGVASECRSGESARMVDMR